jgi:lipopolysaccharide transport system permease protein
LASGVLSLRLLVSVSLMKQDATTLGQPADPALAGLKAIVAVTDALELSPDVPVTVIEAKSGWLPVDFRELWHYRELLFFLVWRDVKVRYKQTVLGAAWAIIQPVFSMVIFSIIFGAFAKIPSDGVPYPIFVLAALLPWTFFTNAVSGAGTSLVSQANLLTKIYFPRLYIPTAAIGVCGVDFLLSFLVYIGIMLWYMRLPGPSILLLPLLLALMFLASAGVGFLLASVTIVYRDFRHVVPFMLQAWMYASPVVYPISMLPEKYRLLAAANPMVGIIEGFRAVLLNQPMNWPLLGVSGGVAVAVFLLGLYNFRRSERFFADVA